MIGSLVGRTNLTPKLGVQSFVNADGTAKKTIATAGTAGSKVTAINVSSTDTSTRLAQLYVTRSAVSYFIVALTIAIGAGTDGATASQNLINTTICPSLPVDADGQPYLLLESGDTLQVAFAVAITAAKEIDIETVFGNY